MSELFNACEIQKGAEISNCGRYRYRLTRTWDASLPPVCWVMLNPSTADATHDDPTIKKCCKFARAWGHGGIVVVNLFAYRATDPKELRKAVEPIIGRDNDEHILAATEGRRIIAAWGTDGEIQGRDYEVVELLAGRRIECLGTTKGGHPRHPLYMRDDTSPLPFDIRCAGGVQ